MRIRDLATLVVVVGALVLAGLDKIDTEVLLALIGGAALPSPFERATTPDV